MDKDKILREHIVKLLSGGQAYAPFDAIIKDFPEDHLNTIFPNGTYSAWHLLEHIRRTQNDILAFMVNPDYQEKNWPEDYWPEKGEKATKKEWDKTVAGFKNDMDQLQKMAGDPNVDLYVKIKWGDGQTNLREFLLVADHNSYHLGEFSIMRQVMKTWRKQH